MKIITGKHKNRVIPTLKKSDYRPSTTKFREALFSILSSGEFLESQSIVNSRVLDLFAGTGSLSFEALSRGADSITLVEENENYLKLAMEFAHKIGEEEQVRVLLMNAVDLVQASSKYDLIFMDPPYYNDYIKKILKILIIREWLAQDAIVAIEMEIHKKIEMPKELKIIKEKVYSNNKLLILKYQQS